MVTGRSEVITIVTAVFFGISLVTVLLRCFVRLRVVRAFGWDDCLMVIAMVSSQYHSMMPGFELTATDFQYRVCSMRLVGCEIRHRSPH